VRQKIHGETFAACFETAKLSPSEICPVYGIQASRGIATGSEELPCTAVQPSGNTASQLNKCSCKATGKSHLVW